MTAPKPKLTEAVVLALLRDRHTGTGNGGNGEHAFLTHVRNAAGFNANRTFDALALNLWPSRGLTLEIYEVKVSRSDWLRELKKPDKAEDACQIADKFSIVAPAGCVKDGELPPTWGLIEVHGDGTDDQPWRLRTSTTAPLLHDDPHRRLLLPRAFVVGMLRSTPDAIPGGKVKSPAAKALADARAEGLHEGYTKGVEDTERRHSLSMDRADGEAWRSFHRALRDAGAPPGVSITDAVPQIAAILAGRRSERRLDHLAGQLEQAAADIRAAAQAQEATP